MQMCCNPIQ